MFAVRGIAVSLSIFVLVYSALSVVVRGMWRRVRFCSQQHPQRRCADLLFALRTLPFVSCCSNLAPAVNAWGECPCC